MPYLYDMNRIVFGLSLDAGAFHKKAGTYFYGRKSFLRHLERHLGLTHPEKNLDWLRKALFRKLVKDFLDVHPDVFFADSYEADPYGTGAAVLDLRDGLRLAGFDFVETEDMPARLATLCALERHVRKALEATGQKAVFASGFAERFVAVLDAVEGEDFSNYDVRILEPRDLLPPWWRVLLARLGKAGARVHYDDLSADVPDDGSDLARVRQALSGDGDADKTPLNLSGDGSIVLVRTPRDYDSLEMFAYAYASQQEDKPFLIIPPELVLPDKVFEADGFPVCGIASVSTLRPSQQLIKLAALFLWWPLDLSRLLEFLSLPYSPLHPRLARLLARALQDRPGFENEAWARALEVFRQQTDDEDVYAQALFEYRFWFERARALHQDSVEVDTVTELYRHLAEWARQRLVDTDSETNRTIYTGIHRLSRDMLEMIGLVGSTRLSVQELNALTDIVLQPSPMAHRDRQVGAPDFAYNPGGVGFAHKEVVWFNFIANQGPVGPLPWRGREIEYLGQKGVEFWSVKDQNRLRQWQYRQPVWAAQRRLILLVPEKVNGKLAYKHPLHYELDALIVNPEAIVLDATVDREALHRLFAPRPHTRVEPVRRFVSDCIIPVPAVNGAPALSVTAIRNFLYYPHIWYLRHEAMLSGGHITGIKDTDRLKGNIAHKLFERLWQEPLEQMDDGDIDASFDRHFEELVRQEGLPFFEYGREPELAAYRAQLRMSVYKFVYALRDNGWRVVAREQAIEGQIGPCDVTGVVDMVLERDGHYLIVDFKWGGISARRDLLRNDEDLQLMLYAKFYGSPDRYWDTCFYIISRGVFLTRTRGLLIEAEVLNREDRGIDEVYSRAFQVAERTLVWRLAQLGNGQLELRTEQNIPDLDSRYGEEVLELMPLPTKSNRYDDYGFLIGEAD